MKEITETRSKAVWFLIFVISLVVIYYYLRHQIRQYTIRQREQKKELEKQNRRQKSQKYTSQLKTFVLNNYGSDGGYWDFNAEVNYIAPDDPTDDFTAEGCNPRWVDRDGSTWEMLKVYIGKIQEIESRSPFYLTTEERRFNVNHLSCGGFDFQKNPFTGKWQIIDRGIVYGQYDTPYQAKLAANKSEKTWEWE
ncbi:hypothetical protein AY600_00545 [Phormidium willei BDU 130791]|nr:hypothetical protein AY600_00545 [Phormidium willei BDU 130791]